MTHNTNRFPVTLLCSGTAMSNGVIVCHNLDRHSEILSRTRNATDSRMQNDESAIWITGIGMVSAAGRGLAETLDTFASGRVNAGPLTLFPSDISSPVFEVRGELPGTASDMRTLRLARLALEEALRTACLPPPVLRGFSVAVCLGTTVASQLNDLFFYAAFRQGLDVSPDSVERYLKSNLAATLAREIGAEGPSVTITNACSSGADALAVAADWLRVGLCDLAFAGGADELNRVPLCGFHALGVMSSEVCRPFDVGRNGLNLGEGAAILVLERATHARRRGRPPLAALVGWGMACDAYHLTAPRPDGSGLEQAIRTALLDARVDASDIGFVNAHGTATLDNDRVEGAVLARVFGPTVSVLSTKGFTGHTLGAAGALEAAFTVAALEAGWIPASAGFATPDPAIPIAPVPVRTPFVGTSALSTSLAFGGNNTALLFQRVLPCASTV